MTDGSGIVVVGERIKLSFSKNSHVRFDLGAKAKDNVFALVLECSIYTIGTFINHTAVIVPFVLMWS